MRSIIAAGVLALIFATPALADGPINPLTANVAGNGIAVSNPTGLSKISATITLNAQTGTSYAIAASDGGKLVTASNASSQAYTIVAATTTGYGTGFGVDVMNIGAGTVTLTPTTSTINGGANITIAPNQSAWIWSDGTNYHAIFSSVGGGSTSPGGSTTQVQVNNAGSFGGIATLTVDLTHGYETNAASPGGDALASKSALTFTGIPDTAANSSCSATTCFPLIYLGNGSASSSLNTAGTYFGINAVAGFTGLLMDEFVSGSATHALQLTATGQLSVASNVLSNAGVQAGAANGFTINTHGKLVAPADGVWEFLNNAGTSFTGIDFGGATNSFARLGIAGLTFALQDATGAAVQYASCTGLTTSASGILACTVSDKRLKTPKGLLNDPLAVVLSIPAPDIFTYHDNKALKYVAPDKTKHIGLYAQDVCKAAPLACVTQGRGVKNYDDRAVIAMLVGAVHQLQGEIKALQNERHH